MVIQYYCKRLNFNPRSLTGATRAPTLAPAADAISIHAPSRERHAAAKILQSNANFNPRSLTGATMLMARRVAMWPISIHAPSRERLYTSQQHAVDSVISIHAPSRERRHQNKLLLYSFKSSIFCELAQLKYSKIYFDVRKLIVSHSSLSCEPKLNFMFHITSHHEPKLHKR